MNPIRRRSSEYSVSFDSSLSANHIEIDEVSKHTARRHLYGLLFKDWVACLGVIPSLIIGALPCLLIWLGIDLVNALIDWMTSTTMIPLLWDTVMKMIYQKVAELVLAQNPNAPESFIKQYFENFIKANPDQVAGGMVQGLQQIGHAIPANPMVLSTYQGVYDFLFYDPMPTVEERLWKMAIVGAVVAIAKFFEQVLWVRAGSRLSVRLRTNLFTNMMRSEVAFFDVNPIGGVLTLLSEDSESVQIAFGEIKSVQLIAIAQGLTCIIWAFCIKWDITLISLAVVPVVLIALLCVIPPILKAASIRFTHVSKSMTICEETLSAIRTVRGFNREEVETKRFTRETRKAAYNESKMALYATLLTVIILIVVIADLLSNMYYGTWLQYKGKISYGDMFAAMAFTGLGSMGIVSLQATMQGEQKAIDSGARIMKLSEHMPSIPFEGGEIIEDFKGHIEFQNVSFKYPTREVYVLKNVSFEIKPGQSGALVGHSGSGKSTCVQLLERYYDIQEGIILIDGKDIKTLDPHWLHQKIALVSQEPVLFRMSLRDNIKYGKANANDEDILNAIEVANATKILEKLDSGLDTLVGEKGSSLSGGQRQRIAIARAVIKKPVILICDEATSALDAGSEKKVQVALDKVMESCTSVIVAHRLSTIRNANIIYVFDAGEIKEVGTHAELVERGGYYYNLVFKQLTAEDQNKKKAHDHVVNGEEVQPVESTDDESSSSSSKENDEE